MRNQILLAVAALVLVTGCLGRGGDTPVPPPGAEDAAAAIPTGPQTYAFGIRECTSVVAAIGVPQAAVRPYLPDGWRSLSLQEIGVGGAPNPGDDGNIGIDMFVCKEVDGIEGPVPDAVYGSLWSAVEPPEEYRRDVDFHFVKWDTVVADPVLRARLLAAGAPVVTAEATLDDFSQLPTGTASYATSIAFSNGWSAAFEGAAAAPFPPTGSFVEYTAVPAGFIEYYAEFRFDPVALGPTSVTLEGPGLAADIAGAGTHDGVAFAGIQWWENATVTIPG